MFKEKRPIPGFENYEVDVEGRVLNRDTGRVLKPIPHNPSGRLTVVLYRNGVGHRVYVHRAVAETFIKDFKQTDQVIQKDNNPRNAALRNLKLWRKRRSRYTPFRRPGRRVLCMENDRTYINAYAAAEDLQIHPSGVYKVLRGEVKKVHGYTFAYVEVTP